MERHSEVSKERTEGEREICWISFCSPFFITQRA